MITQEVIHQIHQLLVWLLSISQSTYGATGCIKASYGLRSYGFLFPIVLQCSTKVDDGKVQWPIIRQSFP